MASEDYAKAHDGNVSIYTLAGIPVLVSALHCLLIELNSGRLLTLSSRREVLKHLASSTSGIGVILKHYPIPAGLAGRLEILREVRHEIVHPAHRPGGTRRNTPAYLARLRQGHLLQSTGHADDHIWISQLQSHRLFRWSFETVRQTVDVLLDAHQVQEVARIGLRASYSRFQQSRGQSREGG